MGWGCPGMQRLPGLWRPLGFALQVNITDLISGTAILAISRAGLGAERSERLV
jgi:hypothetical protein